MNNNEEIVTAFFRKVNQSSIFPQVLKQKSKSYEINTQELSKLNSEEIQRLRSIIITKKQNEPEFKQRLELQWNECQKKIFNWVALCYAQLNSKKLEDLDDEDLDYLSSITTEKSLPLIKYHICTLIKQQSRPKWAQQEDKILYQILAIEKKYKTQGEWILVSKELFLRGDHRMYKSAKSCRERWFNHVDPALSKQWTEEEDRIMLEIVQKEGKKWAFICNKLKHAKNQHMIKNRFHSLLKKYQKSSKEDLEQEEIVDRILKSKQRQINSSLNKQKDTTIVKVQAREKVLTHHKDRKQQDSEMKLISSYQFNPTLTKQPQDNHFIFIPHANQLETSKFFKQQNEQKDGKPSDLLKLSQSLSYNIVYPSPIPVTPGCDLNLFNENHSGQTSFKNTFKFNLNDFISKKIE